MSSASIFSQRDYALYRNHLTWSLQMRSPLTGRYVEVHVEAVLTLVGEHGQQALELANARARMDEQRVLARGGRWRRLRTRRPQRVRQPRVSPLRRGHRRHVSGRQGTFVTNLSEGRKEEGFVFIYQQNTLGSFPTWRKQTQICRRRK